jgi:prepilin-type N-terminal cleavage/methylation domain-containing protein
MSLRSSPAARTTMGLGPRGSRSAGFTLMEVMVALIIFSVGLLGLASVLPLGINRVTDSASDTRASELAAERAEKVITSPYDDPDNDAGDHTDPHNPRDGVYNVSWSVEVNQPITSCKRVTISVTKTDQANPLVTLMCVVNLAGS